MSNYRVVRQAYPTEYWEEYGDEVLDTANEMHDEQWSFRESRHLLAHGLRTRSLTATGGSIEQMLVQGLVLWLAFGSLTGLSFTVAKTLGLYDTYGASNQLTVAELGGSLASLALLFLLTRSSGKWVMLAHSALPLWSLLFGDWQIGNRWIFVAPTLVAALVVAIRGDGRPVVHAKAAFAVLIAGIVLWSSQINLFTIAPIAALFGLFALRLEPRLLSFSGFSILSFGSFHLAISGLTSGIWLISTLIGAVALAVATVGQRRVRSY